jgi:AcrR family transcriptional regulator
MGPSLRRGPDRYGATGAQAQWRRERLLDAALATFVDKGIDGATVKDITAAAGVTQGLLYHYFDDKDALVQAILAERGFPAQQERCSSAVAARPPRPGASQWHGRREGCRCAWRLRRQGATG